MHRVVCLAVLLSSALFCLSPRVAAAQAAELDASQVVASDVLVADDASLPDRGETNTLVHVGLSLTVSGLTTAALGTSLLIPLVAWGIPGGTFAGIGGLLMMIGMPIWIAGGIRRDVLNARPEDRARIGDAYELAGIVTTFLSLAMSLAGGAALAFAGSTQAGAISGLTLLPLGAGIAHFVGIPMWCEGARF